MDPIIHYDDSGLIIHSHGDCHFGEDGGIIHSRDPAQEAKCQLDGGDTAQREGWYWFGVWIRDHTPNMPKWEQKRRLTFDQVLDLLEPKHDGVFYRHPKIAPWNNPYDKASGTSRDQLVPLIAAMGVYGQTARLNRLWKAMPEDVIGKKAFNGNWRSPIGQNGWDCTSIKARRCGPTLDCTLPPAPDVDCSGLQADSENCSLSLITANCSQPHDDDECRAFGHKNGNPFCVTRRELTNARHDQDKLGCETLKASGNAVLMTVEATCNLRKDVFNDTMSRMKQGCAMQNASSRAMFNRAGSLCTAAKTSTAAPCEAFKFAATEACEFTNYFSGDPFGPEYVNLFMRALGRNPLLPNLDMYSDDFPPIFQAGPLGEAELAANTQFRIDASHKDRDDVGPDLNHMIVLIMSELRWPTPISLAAVHKYAVERSHSYGSYLIKDEAVNGAEVSDMKPRIEAGIKQGWIPETPASYGAIKWYFRAITGANPALGSLYAPIIDRYIK